MSPVLFVAALLLQDPEVAGGAKPFRARVRIEFASKVRDTVRVLEGQLAVRPGDSLAAELRDESRKRIRLDLRRDAAPPDRFFALDLWRRTTEQLRSEFEWRPALSEAALPEAVGNADGRPRSPAPMRLGPSSRVAGDGPSKEERAFVLVPRDPNLRGRSVQVVLGPSRLIRAVVDGPDVTATFVLSEIREVESLEDSTPDADSRNPKSEERR